MSMLYQKQREMDLSKRPEAGLSLRIGFPFRNAILRQQSLYRQEIKLKILICINLFLALNLMLVKVNAYRLNNTGSKSRLNLRPPKRGIIFEKASCKLSSPVKIPPMAHLSNDLPVRRINPYYCPPLNRAWQPKKPVDDRFLRVSMLQPGRTESWSNRYDFNPHKLLKRQFELESGAFLTQHKPVLSPAMMQDGKRNFILGVALSSSELRQLRPLQTMCRKTNILNSRAMLPRGHGIESETNYYNYSGIRDNDSGLSGVEAFFFTQPGYKFRPDLLNQLVD